MVSGPLHPVCNALVNWVTTHALHFIAVVMTMPAPVVTRHDVFLLISARYPYFDSRGEYSEKFLSLAKKSNGERP